MSKRARESLPSFSAKWDELAPRFGLLSQPSTAKFEAFSIPSVRLPPSFHEAIIEEAWRIQDVYQERVVQDREEARLRTFDAYIVPIVALFQGRIIDKPEHCMAPTAYSSGGEVAHELFMIVLLSNRSF